MDSRAIDPLFAFTVTVTPDIVREATRGFIWRFIGWLGVVCFVGGVVMVFGVRSLGPFDWLSNLLAATLIVFVLVFALAFWQRERLSLAKLARMDSPEVRYELTDEGFTAASSLGSTTMRWGAVKGLWRFQRCWLLFFDQATYITIPLEGVPAGALELIAAKVPLHDKRIK